MISRSFLGLAFIAAFAAGCRSNPDRGSDGGAEPVEVDVGSGSPDAVARRAATEIADAACLSERVPRPADAGGRYAVRFARGIVGTGTSSAFSTMVENALLETGRFVLVDDEHAPSVTTRVSGPLGDERALVRLASADDRTWVAVRGDLVQRN